MIHDVFQGGKAVQLFCLPYAGGSSRIYQGWQSLALDVRICPVQLPGRGERFSEPPMRHLAALLRQLVAEVGAHARLPFALFGHSMGGLLAYELARELRRQGLPQPSHLFVSGCAAPQLRTAREPLHDLPDESLIARLREYNGTPEEVLANPELMALMLPILRADFCIVETYGYKPAEPLGMPITVLAGELDPYVTQQQANGWKLETSAPCNVHWFDGDHFFIHSEKKRIVEIVRDELRRYSDPFCKSLQIY